MTKEETNFTPLTAKPLQNIKHPLIISNRTFRATPHFGQMALALAGLFAQIHHVSAHRLGGHGDLGEVLLVVTEVHGEKHLSPKTHSIA